VRSLLCAACGCVMRRHLIKQTTEQITAQSVNNLSLDQNQSRSTEVGTDSEEAPRSVCSLASKPAFLYTNMIRHDAGTY